MEYVSISFETWNVRWSCRMPTSLVTLNDAVLSDRRRKSERREGKLLFFFFSFSTRRAIFLFLYLFFLSPPISPLLALHTLRSVALLSDAARASHGMLTLYSSLLTLNALPRSLSISLSLSLSLSFCLSFTLPVTHSLSFSRSLARSPYRSLFVTDTREAT